MLLIQLFFRSFVLSQSSRPPDLIFYSSAKQQKKKSECNSLQTSRKKLNLQCDRQQWEGRNFKWKFEMKFQKCHMQFARPAKNADCLRKALLTERLWILFEDESNLVKCTSFLLDSFKFWWIIGFLPENDLELLRVHLASSLSWPKLGHLRWLWLTVWELNHLTFLVNKSISTKVVYDSLLWSLFLDLLFGYFDPFVDPQTLRERVAKLVVKEALFCPFAYNEVRLYTVNIQRVESVSKFLNLNWPI